MSAETEKEFLSALTRIALALEYLCNKPFGEGGLLEEVVYKLGHISDSIEVLGSDS